ncbi:mitogen-activated protein kinase kinase kinase 20-like [Pyrus communis]|uniref:mitogen-activated protein kinase kinase kinase 20-like n=1 Tax=Pyrus communis TaxID=23211 RepID=UPI0035C1D701
MVKRKAEEEIRKMWNHGERWLRGALIGKVMAVKSAELFASESIQHEAEVLFEIKACCPFIIERFGKETTTTTDKGDKVYKLLLEYAAGGTLDGLIQRSNGHGLPEAHVKTYTRCILEGLIHIPKCGYIHCDRKPENILLAPTYSTTTSSFVAKIADFGLSKRSKEKYSGWRGTPRYLSPEALKVMKQDQSSDIWSLDCIVFEMLVGKSSWELKPGCSDRVDILDVTMLDHPRTSRIRAEISYVAGDFLEICLAMRPEKRLTAKELLSHPFVVQPQPIKPALGQAYGICFLKPSAKYHASVAIASRIQPTLGFGIRSGV